jgi:hypothetical protein
MPLAEALAAIEAAKGRHSAVADPRIQRFNMEHRGMPCAQAEYAAKLKEEDEAADGMTDWLDSVAKDAVMQNKEWQAQQAAAAAAVVAEAPVAAAVVAARGAAGLAAQVPGALLAAGQLGNPVPVGPAELEQAEEQQQQQQQQQEAAAALIPEAEPMEVEAAGGCVCYDVPKRLCRCACWQDTWPHVSDTLLLCLPGKPFVFMCHT